jgi:peptidoglycan/LPS O-acetylase OafA/YrhL
MLLICVVTVFIISLLLNEIIEKPFLKLRKKILSRKKTEKNKAPEAVIA